MARLRVLCLHGWRTNGKIMKLQTHGLRQTLEPHGAEFVYLDAPFLATGPAPEIVRTVFEKEAPFFQWWDAIKREPANVGKVSEEGSSDQKERSVYNYKGLDHTLDFLMGQIQMLGPIDVLLGFSQGAAAVTVLTAHHKKVYGGLPPWKVCVLVSGFVPRAVEAQHVMHDMFGNPYELDVPSIHVIGKADDMVKQSERLHDYYSGEDKGVQKLKFVHEEGHKFPTPSRHRALYTDIATALAEIVGSN
uniref:Serine hydrolase domain-containing protein n=1 Tax=Globisporangium ultimum (strain ATCC 200006 / CBS 805.95 / DAOM BR144) TaxID=431595 RepID=K3WPL5_GLOUD